MTRAQRIRRVAFGTLEGAVVGIVVGPLVSWVIGLAFLWVSDRISPPTGPPPIEDYSGLLPAVLAFFGIPIGAVILGTVGGVRSWLASEDPEDAARHGAAIWRWAVLVVPIAVGLVAADLLAEEAPGPASIVVYLVVAGAGLAIGILAFRSVRKRSSSPVSSS